MKTYSNALELIEELERNNAIINNYNNAIKDNIRDLNTLKKIGTKYISRSARTVSAFNNEYVEAIDQAEQDNKVILDIIYKLDNETHKAVLVNRFIKGRTMEQTADALHYSVRNITRLQGKALEALELANAELFIKA